MSEIYNLSFAFSLSAVFVCLSNMCFTHVQNRTGKMQNKIFVILLAIVMINGICNSITGFSVPYVPDSPEAEGLVNTSRYFYFVFHTALAPLFFYYISHVCGVNFKAASKRTFFATGLFIFTEILAITNPLTHWVYHYEEPGHIFTRGWGEGIIYVAAAVFLVMSLIYLIKTWRALTPKRRSGILMFASITIAGIIIQLVVPQFKIEILAEAIGLTGIMMIIENEDDRIDNDTGLYNRQAFIIDMGGYIVNKVHLHAISIRITTPEIIAHKRGNDDRKLVEKRVAEYLMSVHEKYNIYRLGRKTYALTVFGKSDEEAYELAKRIGDRFEKPWKLTETMVMLQASFVVADLPRQLATLTDTLYMIDYSTPQGSEKKILSGNDVEKILRGSAIEKSISNGLADGKFEVYYQPTYTLNGRKLHGAEALVRLHDDEMGLLYPDEFIPVAENLGLIDAIDDFVLMDVCRLIKENRLDERKIDCINVNLSVVQLMRPGFTEHVNGLVEQAGVDKHLINFEVTESISAASYETLNTVITELKKEGFLFSMDDYGTGYSNMRALSKMNLDCIKIDKSILWEAEKSGLGRIILENSIRMIRQMDLAILVEGVETEEQIKLLETMDVDYLQGFFFSKPVPKDQFLKIIST